MKSAPLTHIDREGLFMMFLDEYFKSIYVESRLESFVLGMRKRAAKAAASWESLEGELTLMAIDFEALSSRCPRFDAIVEQATVGRNYVDAKYVKQCADIFALRSLAWLRYERMANLVVLSRDVAPALTDQLVALEVELWRLTPVGKSEADRAAMPLAA